jgi:competence protein ComEC
MSDLKLKINKNKGKFVKKMVARLFIFAFFLWLAISQADVLLTVLSYQTKPEINFLDVGQGDAILIKTPNGQTILIDGGPDNKVLRRLGESLPFYRRQIDLVIFSHYHDDHVIGLIEILKRYRVQKIIYAASGSEITATAAILLKKAELEKIPVITIDKQASLNLGDDCILDLLNPASLGIKVDPNNSLVVKLNCAGKKFLFSGDNSAIVEKALLNSGFDLAADVFKASHHGSNSANSEKFFRAVGPELLVIPVGADNKFGHPSPKILERAAALGINIKRTDKDGDIKISPR